MLSFGFCNACRGFQEGFVLNQAGSSAVCAHAGVFKSPREEKEFGFAAKAETERVKINFRFLDGRRTQRLAQEGNVIDFIALNCAGQEGNAVGVAEPDRMTAQCGTGDG